MVVVVVKVKINNNNWFYKMTSTNTPLYIYSKYCNNKKRNHSENVYGFRMLKVFFLQMKALSMLNEFIHITQCVHIQKVNHFN